MTSLLLVFAMVTPVFAIGTTTSATERQPQEPGIGALNAEEYLDKITPENAPRKPLGFDSTSIQNEKQAVSLVQNIISTLTGFLAAIAGTFAVFMVLYQSYHLITSNGDSKKATDARNGILWSLIGLLGIMFSYLIIFTIVDTLFRIGSGAGL